MNSAATYLSDTANLQSVRRALVIKLRHHGDVLLTTPVFQALKNHAPHMEIDALIYHDTRDMLTQHPAISHVLTIDRQWKNQGFETQMRGEWKLLRTLQSREYDLIVHLTEHNRGAWLVRLLGPRYSVARNHPKQSRLWKSSFTHLYPHPKATQRHTVELNLDALRRLGIQPTADERRLILVPGEGAEQAVDELLARHELKGQPFIQIHPTSRWFFKTWPVERVADLCNILHAQGHRIVLTSAPDEREKQMIEAIRSKMTTQPVDLSGQLTLKQLAALTAKASLFVGVDSAPMHIAAAVQTPIVVLFGPSGDIEWGPWMVPNRIVTSNHVCRPCGNDGCGGGKISECLTMLPVNQVLAAIQQLL